MNSKRHVILIVFLLHFIIILHNVQQNDASEDIQKQSSIRARLRRPTKRNQASSSTTTTSTATQTASSVSPTKTRSRFRIKSSNTGFVSKSKNRFTGNIDQDAAGSIQTQSRLALSSTRRKQNSNDGYKLVCYYTNWSQYRPKVGRFLPEDIPADLCTHLIFAFGWLKKGKLSSFETNDETKDGKPGFYERMNNLKKSNPKLKTLLAIGGWSFGTAKFKEMSATRYTRQTFIFSAIPYLRERNFDGLDMDWEYPKGSVDKKNFVTLLKELQEAFNAEAEETGNPKLLLTAAVPVGPDSIRGGYDVPLVSKYLDFINLMAYDFHGKWESQTGHNAPLYAPSSDSEWRKQLSVENAAKTWVKLGAEKSKLVIGMPTYGRSFQLSNKHNYSVNVATKGGGTAGIYTKESGFLAYYEICEILQSGKALYVWDEEMKVPYMVADDQWVGFDDEKAIRNKIKWLKKEGYAGAMVWSIDMDDFTGTVCPGGIKYPLITSMKEELHGIKKAGSDVDWTQIAATPEDAQSLDPKPDGEPIDPAEVIAAALKKRKRPLAALNAQPEEQKTRSPVVMCVITKEAEKKHWKSSFNLDKFDSTMCTHVIYEYGSIRDNKLVVQGEVDSSESGEAFSQLKKLKETNPNLKILLGLGSFTSGAKAFKTLTSNVYRLNNFVYSTTEFLRENEFDGIDVNWQFPNGNSDKNAHLNLITELRMAFEGEAKTSKIQRLLLTITASAQEDTILKGYSIPELAKFVDFINLMSYDFHGSWESIVGHNSPLTPIESASADAKKLTVTHAAKIWVLEGAPAEKILIGLPTFGRTFTLENPEKFDIGAPAKGPGLPGKYTDEEGFLAYYEICDRLADPNTTLVWDNEQNVPFAYNGDQWIGFDDERSYKTKIDWLKDEKFGGVMIWSMETEDFQNNCGTGKYPLVSTVKEELGEYRVPLVYNGPYEGPLGGSKSGAKDPNEVSCDEEDGHISYHPDKSDCSKYFMCEGERKHHMPCPANLVFNPDQNVCDWIENVESCKDFVKEI